MKVKLIIIETFDPEPKRPTPPEYFFHGDHMDEFLYSPPQCEKQIATYFNRKQKSTRPRGLPQAGYFIDGFS